MDMHGRIMELDGHDVSGHYIARHAAAEIASEGDALIAEMLAALESLVSCIDSTRGKNADEALHASRTAIAKARAFGVRS